MTPTAATARPLPDNSQAGSRLEIGGRRVLVPAAEEFIAHIDFEGLTMKMILPEGLIDL